MLYTIKNKEKFETLKKANKRIQKNKNNKEIYEQEKMIKNMLVYNLKRIIKDEIKIVSKIKNIVAIMNNNKINEIQYKIMLYEIQRIENEELTLITLKNLDKLFKEEITLEDIYNDCKSNKIEHCDKLYSYQLINKENIDIFNLEQCLKNSIEINKLRIFFLEEGHAFMQQFYPGRGNYQNIIIKVKPNNPICLYNYLKDLNNDDLKYIFKDKVIDTLINYEIINLREIEINYYLDNDKDCNRRQKRLDLYRKYRNNTEESNFQMKWTKDEEKLKMLKEKYEECNKAIDELASKYRIEWRVNGEKTNFK